MAAANKYLVIKPILLSMNLFLHLVSDFLPIKFSANFHPIAKMFTYFYVS